MGIKQTMQVLTTARSTSVELALVRALDQPDDRIASAAVEAAVHHPTAAISEALIRNFNDFDEAGREAIARSVYRFHDFFLAAAQQGQPEILETLFEICDRHNGVDVLDLLMIFLSSEEGKHGRRVEEMISTNIEVFLAAPHHKTVEEGEGSDHQDDQETKQLHRDAVTVQRAFRLGLQSFPFHQSAIVVRGALRLGKMGYRLVNEALKRDSRVNSAKDAIIAVLVPDSTPDTMAYCFSLLQHELAFFRRIGQTIFRAKRGQSQEEAVLKWLADKSPAEKRELMAKNRGPVWLEVFEHRTHLLGDGELEFIADQLDLLDEREEVKLRYWALLTDSDDLALSKRAMQRITAMRSKEAQETMLELLESPREDVQIAVINELERLRHRDILKLLAPKVASKHERVRKVASKIVGRISFNRYLASFDKLDDHTREVAGRSVLELDEDNIYALAEELQAIDPAARLKAVRIIEATGSFAHLQDAVLALVSDPDKKVRATIIHLLAAMKNGPAIKALVRLLSDKDTRVQANALEALEELHQPSSKQLIVPFLRSPNNRVRANACHALWSLGVHKVSHFMFEMLKSRDKRMRLSGAWVIGECKPEGGVKALNEALEREDLLEAKTAMRRALKRFEEAADRIEGDQKGEQK